MESSSIQTMAKIIHPYKSRRKSKTETPKCIFAMTRIDGNSSIQTKAKIKIPYKSWRKLKTERPKVDFATTRIDRNSSIRVKAKIKKDKNPEGEIDFRLDSYRWKAHRYKLWRKYFIDTSQGENWNQDWFSPWLVSMDKTHRYESRRK